MQLKHDTIERNDGIITDWQKDYYENQLLLKKYRVDSEQVKQYFQVDNVIKGLFAISSQLFDIKFREIENPSVWHSDVRMFELKEKSDNTLVGYLH